MNEIARLTVRISNDLKNDLEKFAEQHNTTLNALISETLQEKLKNGNQSASNKNIESEKINNENFEILQDKVDYLMQKVEHLKAEMQKEILEDFKIFANVLAKKIKETNMQTETLLTINKPLKFQTIKNFAEANKKPFIRKDDLIAAIDVYSESAELKIYKILEANSYTNIKTKNIENENEVVKIDLTNEIHYLSILRIYRKI